MRRIHVPVAVFVLVVLSYMAFFVWTLRRLWRRSDDTHPVLIYRYGVKLGGLLALAGFMIDFAVGDPRLRPIGWREWLVTAFMTCPLALWIGYFIGQGLQRYRDSKGPIR